MTSKGKVALLAAVAAAIAFWIWWPDTVAPPPAPGTNPNGSAAELQQADPGAAENGIETARVEDVDRQAVTPDTTPAEGPSTGSVVVHVRYGDDKTPATGMPMALRKIGHDSRFSSLREHTDETGTARFDDVAPGKLYVAPVNLRGKRVEVVAGQTAEVEIELRVGMNIRGIVVDADKNPVADALIEVAPMAHADAFPEVRAISGPDGRFTIRASDTLALVGARARGHVASAVRFLHGKEGNDHEVELVLGPAGGTVAGTVADEDGKPIAFATVVIGEGELSGIAGRDHIPPFPALTRSDEHGRFEAVGIPAGTQPVKCRAQGYAPSETECEIAAGTSTTLTITLVPGATIRGLVVDEEDQPVDQVGIRIGDWSDFAFARARTEADGRFEMSGLPEGELKLLASHDDLGKAEKVVVTESRKTVETQLKLSRGFLLRGRVIDPEGNPIPNVYCECIEENPSDKTWFKFAKANAQGEFVADNCPEKGTVSIRVSARNFEELRKTGIDPHAGPVVLQLKRRPPSTVRISGTVLMPDGTPLVGASISPARREARGGVGLESTDNAGRFEIGPYPEGTWRITVRSSDYPTFRSEWKALGANETWELGTISLQHGGTATVTQTGNTELKAYFVATDPKLETFVGFQTVDGVKRSTPMLPGEYLLLTTGKGVAASSQRFTVRAGEDTQLECAVQAGIAQPIRVARANGKKLEPFSVLIHRGAIYCGRVYARAQRDGSLLADAYLAPGTYTATAELDGVSGTVNLTVGTAPGSEASITLR